MSKLVNDLYDLLSLAKEESEPNRYDNSDEYKELKVVDELYYNEWKKLVLERNED